jgi:uncharacterized delta-60 repeat protein
MTMKKKKIYLVVFMLILYCSFLLQGTTIISNLQDKRNHKDIELPLIASKTITCEWYRIWGGADYDEGTGMAVDSSGDIYLVGGTFSYGAGDFDIVLVKYDENGTQQWNCTWGGIDYDIGLGMVVDSLDNLYIAGYTHSFGAGGADMVLLKYNKNGIQQWNYTWGGNSTDSGHGVTVDSSGNIYLVGATFSFGAGDFDIVLVKYDENGVQQWNRTWGGENRDYGHGVVVDSSDNVFIAGYTWSFGAGSADVVLVKYDGNGIQQWNRTWGGEDLDYGYGVAIDSLDNVYIIGGTESFGAGDYDMALIKYNENGTQQWNHTWGGTDDEGGYGVTVDSLDNVYITGSTYSFGAGESDMALVKYDGNGVQRGSHTWGGVDWDGGSQVAVDSSDNVYLTGTTYRVGEGDYDMVLIKYASIERPPFDEFIMILIIVVSIASTVGVGIAITYVIRKRRKVVD